MSFANFPGFKRVVFSVEKGLSARFAITLEIKKIAIRNGMKALNKSKMIPSRRTSLITKFVLSNSIILFSKIIK